MTKGEKKDRSTLTPLRAWSSQDTAHLKSQGALKPTEKRLGATGLLTCLSRKELLQNRQLLKPIPAVQVHRTSTGGGWGKRERGNIGKEGEARGEKP